MGIASSVQIWLKICVLSLTLVGWGYLASRLLDVASRRQTSFAGSLRFFEFGVIGLGIVYVLAILISLFAPLDSAAEWLFFLGGSAGAAWLASHRMPSRNKPYRDYIGFAALTALAANGTAHTPMNYDAGLYHLQALSYFHRAALPLGIANINMRLGFTSSWFPLSALCAGSVFGADGPFLLNAATMTIFVGAMLSFAVEDWRTSKFRTAEAYASAVVLLLLASGVLFEWFGLSPAADLPSALSCAYAFLAFLAAIEALCNTADPSNSEGEAGRHLLLLVGSSTLALTAKVSQAPAILLVLILALLGLRQWREKYLHECYCAAVLGSLVIGAWLVQGLITSGCLVFPMRASCFAFLPWEIDPAKATYVSMLIHTWAKAPGVPADQIKDGLAWLPMWRDKMLTWRDFVYKLAWAAAGLQVIGLAAFLWVRRQASEGPLFPREYLYAFGVSLLGVLSWFFGAPDPRFGIGFLTAVPALTFAFMAGMSLRAEVTGRLRRIGIPALGVLLLLTAAVKCVALNREDRATLAWRNIPKPAVRSLLTSTGVKVMAPREGDQCWNVAPPCTPDPVNTLKRSMFAGHVMYTHDGPNVEPTVDLSGGEGPFQVTLDPKTWGAEPVTYNGKPHHLRWLQSETEFVLNNDEPNIQPVIITLDLATFKRPRQVQILLNGELLPEAPEISQDFWGAGAKTVQYTASLRPGRNAAVLKASGEMDPLPGNRPVSLLLFDDIRVAVRRR